MSLFSATFSPAYAQECQMDMSFNTQNSVDTWRVINDGVMGGRSSGGPRFENGVMVFEGRINTNGGGFSSIRLDVEAGLLAQADALSLRVKSDGRGYKMGFRTDARYRGRPISFQAPIPPTEAGQWSDVRVPLDGLRASLFGRAIEGAQFDKSRIWEIGFILADGQDGPFRLEIKSLKACPN
jgi:hypothetical protein